ETRQMLEGLGAPASSNVERPASSNVERPQAARAPSSETPAGLANPIIVVAATNLAQSIRRYGHLASKIDPLGSERAGDPSLLPETHRVSEADLRALPASLIPGPVSAGVGSMWDLYEKLRSIYCGTT